MDGNVKGVEFLLKKNKVDVYMGAAKILAPGKVEVKLDADGKFETLETKNILVATGSDVAPLPGVAIDEKRIVSSTGALSLDRCQASSWWWAPASSAWARLRVAAPRRPGHLSAGFQDTSCPAWTAARWPAPSSASWKSRASRSSSAPRSRAWIPRARP